MDLYQLLTKDHDNVKDLFKKIGRTSDGATKTRERLCSEFALELDVHTRAEEAHFYPVLKRHDETKGHVAEAMREHQEAKKMLAELQKMDIGDEEFLEQAKKLQAAVQHHIREEEQEIFPAAKKALDDRQSQQIADKIMEMKKQERAA